MTTSTDITNQALQLLGTRTTVASLAEQSNEAIQANLVYSSIVDWCLALTPWNFAMKVALLTRVKTGAGTVWSTASPAPAWQYEYSLPSDFIKALYLTNSDTIAAGQYRGEPKRFVLMTDTISAAQQEVLLTNESVAILLYASRVSDPTLWPQYFSRFAVAALASALALALTQDMNLDGKLHEHMMNLFTIAETMNRQEVLGTDSPTPEWVQALGIPYPFKRDNITARTYKSSEPSGSNGNNKR